VAVLVVVTQPFQILVALVVVEAVTQQALTLLQEHQVKVLEVVMETQLVLTVQAVVAEALALSVLMLLLIRAVMVEQV
jgi:hypothetical protein